MKASRCPHRFIPVRSAIFALTWAICLTIGCSQIHAQAQPDKVQEHNDFDVVIAGGSTAAFAAAIASAKSGARTALLEPTDWVGGQLTSSAVPAIDEAWHKISDAESGEVLLNVSQWARDPRNITPSFLATLRGIRDCGDCWVSRFCFRPREYLQTQLLPLRTQQANNLVVFLETVVKRVELDRTGSRIRSISAIRRRPVVGQGYDKLPSEDLPDWYSPADSPRFTKEMLHFRSRDNASTVFVDATEWGEVLALSGTDYLQGTEDEEGEPGGNDTCGQSIVYCFVQKLHAETVEQSAPSGDASRLGLGDYQEKKDAWNLIWTYRRILGKGEPSAGDLCLQNWGYSPSREQGGNDYPFAYLFKSKIETAKERADWQGGVDLAVLAAAEQRAYGWHHWFRRHAPALLQPDQFSLAGGELGTQHGLAKLPYIRDTRRSIGLDGFMLKFDDLTGPASQQMGTVFEDRIALGAYPADIHPLSDCELPAHLSTHHDTLPFHIPFRALTHHQLENLLVAGKTMAQSFLANSATRLHPIEWSTGTAAGVAAAHMATSGRTSREALEHIHEIQAMVQKETPIDWTPPDSP